MKNILYANNLKPPLKWAGGKRWLVPHLMPIWEPYSHCRLVEPLCGGLAVTLGLMPEKALLNDINIHLLNFFKWVQKGLHIDIPLENKEEFYYSHRERFNTLIEEGNMNSKEAAGLFYYLNRTGFNGLCRFNQKDRFNVPFGRYKNINYIRNYDQYREVFKHWEFTCTDFEELPLKDGDFIYADPPYDVEFTSYSKGGFSWEDQVRLVRWLVKHPGPVVLSNQATERILKLYGEYGFKIRYFDAPRRISCNGDRTPAKEVLATRGF
ncbi:MAG: DNA adenine methylase [Bacillota bacterium]